jgi:crotonobetainyl-CoA:carnitine CoA-transferase CaiB-like acyl-CoA transferase
MMNGAPWYDCYRCSCGGVVAIGAIEPKFYKLLLKMLGLENDAAFSKQHDRAAWHRQRATLVKIFAEHDVMHWRKLLEGSDVCFAPVLNPIEAVEHKHMKARGAYFMQDGHLQAAPAPRFRDGGTNRAGPVPRRGADNNEILRALGRSAAEISELRKDGAIG